MVEILDFCGVKTHKNRQTFSNRVDGNIATDADAEIIIFPGVRYERTPTKSGKRKTRSKGRAKSKKMS